MLSKQIVLWSSYSCQLCSDIKAYFHEQQLAYTNKDMKETPALRDELEQKYGAPVIEIENDVIIGDGQFSEDNWKQLKSLIEKKEVS